MVNTTSDAPDDFRRPAHRLLSAQCARCSNPSDSDQLYEYRCALERLERGTWGSCEGCRVAIGRNRLLALPEARQCADCRSACAARQASSLS